MFLLLFLVFLICVATGTVSLFFNGLLWLAIIAFISAAAALIWSAAEYLHRKRVANSGAQTTG